MKSKKLLKEAYQILIPIANKILFDTETPPNQELKGFKLSDGFIKSYEEQKKDDNSIVMRIIEVIYHTIFSYNTEQKKQIIGIFYDNEQLIQITYLTTANHQEITLNQFVEKVFSDYFTKNLSAELTVFLNYHFVFIYENEFVNGYISKNKYIEIIKSISQRTSFI